MNGNLRRIAATDLRRIKDDEGFREALVDVGAMGLGDSSRGVLVGLPWYLRLRFQLKDVKTGPQAGIRANAALPDRASGGEVLRSPQVPAWHAWVDFSGSLGGPTAA